VFPSLTVALVLLAVSAALLWSHWTTWRRVRDERLEGAERRFAWGQFRRRMQSSGMVGIVGALMLAAPWVRAPLAVLFYWSGIVLLLVWIILLATADALATRVHFSQLRRDDLIEEIQLRARLSQLRRQNGHDGSPDNPPQC
jgi:hypothetical protein